ncbi:hypothetical protein QE380_001006 [Acinetobacter baylyi]|uniref:Uncharacterized protein n=3 Tax=Acinetobacter baylyi TaxID=202950 RepID=Q6FD00_ACIAD|nr:hypothetical protein [Acinetobacter baylyi]ENV54787.1 hypothetical protein F952_01473 [Acinetobacter baylyi DSM 14961 = CIP 107474]KAF2370419.1 hypothetical protein BSL88_09895 [Acinetobacter baylyi]KAF2373948.1 hypothetical protein BSL67_09885 [Acinetobacter baylyi]KAF2377821.1 hypothetical protein BSN81_07090 [Acinetobacter baylyi]KAF2379546.1 hypothetical protein BSN83_14905 [Acinetobacter baylyi]
MTKTNQSILLWVIIAHIFMAIIAYEWLPASFRGSWILLLILLIAGSFLSVGWSLILGLFAFICISIYFLLDLANQTYIERQLLLLFLIPLTPIFLSAIRYNLLSHSDHLQELESYQRNTHNDIFPLSSLSTFERELWKIQDNIDTQNSYEIFHIKIQNKTLIQEMLGKDIWKNTQNKILEALAFENNESTFHFADQELESIQSIVIRNDQTNSPEFIQKLKDITTLRLEITHSTQFFKETTLPDQENV